MNALSLQPHCRECGAQLPPAILGGEVRCPQCGRANLVTLELDSGDWRALLKSNLCGEPSSLNQPVRQPEEKHYSDPAMLASTSSPIAMDYFGSKPRVASTPRRSLASTIVFVTVLMAALVIRFLEILPWSWWIVVPAGMATAAVVALVVAAIFRKWIRT